MAENLLLSFDQCVVNLSRQIKHGGDTLKLAPETVKAILGRNRYNEPMWPRRFCEILGEVVTFDTFIEFVEANQPRGLGTTVQILKNICRDDIEAVDLIDQAVRNVHGGDRSKLHNVQLDAPTGNSRDRALRRLRDQRPDLHVRVLAKELSAHAAMIEAGFRTSSFTVPDDVDGAAATLKRRFGDRRPALIRALSGTDVETGAAARDTATENEEPTTVAEIDITIAGTPIKGQQSPVSVPTPADRREAARKKQRASARNAVASDRPVQKVLDWIAAMSDEERAVVADAMADQWGVTAAVLEPEDGEDDDAPSPHAQCIHLPPFKSCWNDSILSMAVHRLIGTAFYAPDAPKPPAPDQASQLIETLRHWIDQLQRPDEAQRARNSAITVDAVANGKTAGSSAADAAIAGTQIEMVPCQPSSGQ